MALFIGQEVITPYGNGKILDIRQSDHVVVVRPTTWELDRGSRPTFFMNPKDVRPKIAINTVIKCNFGAGRVTDYRADGIYVIVLDNWKLAQGQSPTLYLNSDSFTVDTGVPPPPAGPSIFELAIEKAVSFKNEAGEFFKQKEYGKAKQAYLDSLAAMKYLGEDLDNDEKARVLEQTFPCHNNIALCCINMQNYPDGAAFANNVSICYCKFT